jgi:glycogen synthase
VRILVVSNLYPPNVVGGYERLCFEVTSELARRGHEVAVLTSDYGGGVADYPAQRVHRDLRLVVGDTIYTPFAGDDAERARINAANVAAARARVAAGRPDAVFIWNLFFLDGSLFDALVRSGAPRAVLMLTDNWLMVMRNPAFMTGFFEAHMVGDAPFQPPPDPAAPRARSLLDRLLGCRRRPPVDPGPPPIPCAAVFGSRFMQALYHAGGLRFAEERVVHNGVRLDARPASAFRDRSRLARPGELRLLFAGRVTEIKGVHTALEALALLDDAQRLGGVTRVGLTVLGDTRDAAYLDRLHGIVDRLGLAPQVDLQAAVPEDALFALFQDHDVYLFPSLYEPFSLTLIHALAAGIPTVASRVGGNVEIVRDRETGLLFAKGDAADLARRVTELAADPGLRARVSAGGREMAAGFTFERMVGAMETFLAADSGPHTAGPAAPP